MWGLPCDMDPILAIARRRKLLIIEDACQGVGGGYRGRKLGALGDAGAFSFNYYKNITCGEGGAVVTRDPAVAQRMSCMTDCAQFYWQGRQEDVKPFNAAGSRASEFEGAMLNVQLDRLPDMLAALRRNKKRITAETATATRATPIPCHSDEECASHIVFQLPTAPAADAFAAAAGGAVCLKTGRHTYTEWDPILEHRGGHVPAMNPFLFEQNRGCRMTYSKDMCPRSLDILSRTVLIWNHPDRTEPDLAKLIAAIKDAAA